MRALVTLVNDFHGTSVNVRAEVMCHGVHCEIALTDSQWSRVNRKLCGMSDCACGGLRGRQEFDGKKLIAN